MERPETMNAHFLPGRTVTAGLAALALTATLLLGGCEQPSSEEPRQDAVRQTPPTAPSLWREQGNATFVAMPADETDPELEAAIAEARATADDARSRWQAASAEQRQHWAVKWAAPTSDGRIEHVWVRPAQWTVFRIEGRLLSTPLTPLECGMSAGDLVSLATEALTDWVYSPPGGQPEGGFTTVLLEQRYGRPPDQSR